MKRKVTKETILAVSTYYFLNCGIKDGRVNEISRRLKISKKTLYAYFRSKKQLVEECMDYYSAKVYQQVNDIIKLEYPNDKKWYYVIHFLNNTAAEINAKYFIDVFASDQLKEKFNYHKEKVNQLVLHGLVERELRKERTTIFNMFVAHVLNRKVQQFQEIESNYFLDEVSRFYGQYLIEE